MKHKVTITFKKNKRDCLSKGLIETFEVQYGTTRRKKDGTPSKEQIDTVEVYENKTVITADRTSNKLDSAYSITHSTVYDLLISCILYHYYRTREVMEVSKIVVDGKTYDKNNLKQIFAKPCELNHTIDSDEIKIAFDKKKLPRKVLLHYLQAETCIDRKQEFGKLWMAFNCLYSYDSSKRREQVKIQNIKDIINTNQSFFSNSLSAVDKLFSDENIAVLQWKDFISNKIVKASDENRKEFFEHYSEFCDCSVCEKINDSLEKLLNKGVKNQDKETKLQAITNLESYRRFKENAEKVVSNSTQCLIGRLYLIIDYAYYLRCAFFHGEINDSYYELLKSDRYDEELVVVNGVLKKLIQDLLNTKIMNVDYKSSD